MSDTRMDLSAPARTACGVSGADGLLTPEEEEELRRSCGENSASTFEDHQFAGDFQVNVTSPRT